jgi:ABC-type nitrate/sulfonate/bicarbonate transport system substrate-binding protein
LGLNRYILFAVPLILILTAGGYALISFPISHSTNTLKLGYPEEVDEADVTDQYAFQLLAAEGISVTFTTYYQNPSLAYKALLTGQQDIIYDETMGSLISGQDTTCVGGYQLGGAFLAVAGDNITSPSQLLGKTAADFGPGTIMRDLNDYWLKQAGIPINTLGPNPNSVYLEGAGPDVLTVHDLETGQAQEIVADDFILSDLGNPSINNTAHNGPFHVLFHSPTDLFSSCYAVRDDWLINPTNQLLLEKFLAAIYQAQRYFISSPNQFVTFAEQKLPETSPAEIQFASTFYPAQLAYWPYGMYNLEGNENLQLKYNNTNQFFITAGVLTSPVSNESVQPYGVFNKFFELKALTMIGQYTYPDTSWVTPVFASEIQDWVPSWMGGASNTTASTSSDG